MALSIDAATRKDRNAGNGVTLQHRHFAFIAATISDLPNDTGLAKLWRGKVARHFADACARSNPRFDRRRFLVACGVEN